MFYLRSLVGCQKFYPFRVFSSSAYTHSNRRVSTVPGTNMTYASIFQGLDEEQIRLMQEECILIDDKDFKIGTASKKVCHLLENINKGMLHRAFSVFLFNKNNELLLQQRSQFKITFPEHWTNTCCSHPLNRPDEVEEREAVGVRRAAQRKLKHELGIEPTQVPIDGMEYLARIHYASPNVPYDGKWGEHEIDYILFFKGDVEINANKNEVLDYKFVNKDELKQLVDDSNERKLLITPWFKLIVEHFLFPWWDNVNNLSTCKDHTVIHKMLE